MVSDAYTITDTKSNTTVKMADTWYKYKYLVLVHP